MLGVKGAEEVFESVLANRCLFLIQINSRYDGSEIRNELAFKLFLIETDFYINESYAHILR